MAKICQIICHAKDEFLSITRNIINDWKIMHYNMRAFASFEWLKMIEIINVYLITYEQILKEMTVCQSMFVNQTQKRFSRKLQKNDAPEKKNMCSVYLWRMPASSANSIKLLVVGKRINSSRQLKMSWHRGYINIFLKFRKVLN